MSTNRSSGPVYRITGAAPSLTADVNQRTKRYLISMGIRTVCFVLAVLVFTGWLRWLFMVLAIVLPYISVVFANAGRETTVATPVISPHAADADQPPELEPPRP
ncbi:MAG: DUF3099 domain-containing protein [Candidatus Nanopelagicales bacterium]